MEVSQAQEAKQLREENTRLRKLVAYVSLDKEALQFGDSNIQPCFDARKTGHRGEQKII